MSGSFTYGSQPNVNVQEIAFSIYTAVDSAFYDVEYPEQDWYKFIKEDQVISDINAGATNYAFITRDKQGSAAFRGQAENNNIPMVSQTAGAVTVPLCASNIGAKIDSEDARQYQMGFNGSLAQDLGECMRFGCDNLIERAFFFGDKAVGFQGSLNYTGITVATAANNAAGTSTQWVNKTAAEMVKDVQAAIRSVWTTSKSVFVPNVVFVPLEQYSMLNDTPFAIGTSVVFQSALAYLKTNNLYTQLRGKELEIVPIRYLKGAGASSANRMIVQDRSKRNQAMPFPLPYQVLAPVPVPLGSEFYAEQKHGSYAIRQPLSTLYVDGI